jgi:RNA polymerase sigma-70 factor (ECF subfamily)
MVVMANRIPISPAIDAVTVGLEDGQLVEGHASESRSALDRLVAAHQDRVAGLAYRLLGWPEEVDDVVQEVFLAVLKNLDGFRGASSVETWIMTITVNTCRKHQRRRWVRWRWLTRAKRELREGAVESAEGVARQAETSALVRQAVRDLPQRYREVVVLRYLEGMAIAEIGEMLDISVSNVNVRLTRARQRLKVSLAGQVEV